MKRREKDLLLQAAFGDLNEQDRASLAELVNNQSEARKELDQLKELRSGIELLREVPECQLSVERMRDAVLREGVRRRPARAGWVWALGPFVGAAAAIALMVQLNAPKLVAAPSKANFAYEVSSPMPTANSVNPEKLTKSATEIQPMTIVDNTSGGTVVDALLNAVTQVASNPGVLDVARVHRASRHSYIARPTAIKVYPDKQTVVDDRTMALSGDKKPTVIIVNSDRDPGTGAPTATETEESGHVLFGG